MRRAQSSGSTRGEAQARAGDLAPGARPLSPAEAVPSGAALVGRPGGLPRGLSLTAFRDTLSVDGEGLLAGVADGLRRRLPLPVRRVLRSFRRRERAVLGRLRRRWHRSLQLRVVATTMVISAVVVAVLGFFLVQQIASGLLNSTRTYAAHQIGGSARVIRQGIELICRRRRSSGLVILLLTWLTAVSQ